MSTVKTHPLVDGTAPSWADAWGEDEHGPWGELRIGNATQLLRWAPPGQFLMGTDKETEVQADIAHESPQHVVQLTQGFWIFDSPVTQVFWFEVMESKPSHFLGESLPVDSVSWEDASDFCEVLSQKTNARFSLPTEAQWEYACRAGDSALRYGDVGDVAWHDKNSHQQTQAVKKRSPNAWGLYDMLGNVWELCADQGGREYMDWSYDDPHERDQDASYYVLRGGCWHDPAEIVRAAFRNRIVPDLRGDGVGFRCLSSPS